MAGTFCTFTPLEILDAAGMLAVSLCGMSARRSPAAEVDLPRNLCPLIKSSYGFYVSDKCPYTYFSDLIVGETTCDGKKKMYELMARGKELFLLHLPQGVDLPYARDMWRAEVRRLKEYLEERFGAEITDDALRAAARQRNALREARSHLMEVLRADPRPFPARSFTRFSTDWDSTLTSLTLWRMWRSLPRVCGKQSPPPWQGDRGFSSPAARSAACTRRCSARRSARARRSSALKTARASNRRAAA